VWFDLAARAGLTPELEALAIRSALAVIDRSPPPGDTFASVNVSPLLLGDSRIASVLLAPSVPGTRLVLELTERDKVADYDSLRAAVSPYRTAGFRIAVDDTGAGYASLRHITELQPDIVKLDACLITGLTGDRARQAVVRAVATFADEIGAALVAEGVEDLADLELLVRASRQIFAQGYAVGRASAPWSIPSDAFLERLAVNAPAMPSKPALR
jgi:EAL domain-containing protein (putative c-di-GMP-specific phosphodiesterase class I)